MKEERRAAQDQDEGLPMTKKGKQRSRYRNDGSAEVSARTFADNASFFEHMLILGSNDNT